MGDDSIWLLFGNQTWLARTYPINYGGFNMFSWENWICFQWGISWIFHHQVRLPEVKVDFQGRSSWRLVQPRLPAGSTRNNGPWALWMALVSSKSTPPYGRHPSVRPGPVCQQIRRISYDWWTVGRGGASLMHSLRGISKAGFCILPVAGRCLATHTADLQHVVILC